MTELLTVTALDARPILGLVALVGLVALFVAVPAAEYFRLGALARHVANLLAVVTLSSTTSSARSAQRLRTVGLVVAESY
jgi:hypothetical protein